MCVTTNVWAQAPCADLKLQPSTGELVALIGSAAVARLARRFGGDGGMTGCGSGWPYIDNTVRVLQGHSE